MMARISLRTPRALLLLSVLLVLNTLLLVKLIPGPHGIPHGHLAQRDIDLSPTFDAEIAQNQTLLPRVIDEEDQWIEPMYLLVPEEKINALPDDDEKDSEKKRRIIAARKGFQLLCGMKSPTTTIPTDPNFKPREGKSAKEVLADYGWMSMLEPPEEPEDGHVGEFEKLSEVLKALKLSTNPENWIESTIEHKSPSRGPQGDGNYPVTKGSYMNWFDLANGVLIAAYNYGPEDKSKKSGFHIPPKQMVPFQRWSDVVWVGREEAVAKYEQDHAGDGKTAHKLEHVLIHNIVSEPIKEILKMVTGAEYPYEIGAWPGVGYPIEEPQALAVLGAPHVSSVAWMLIQHKEAMGVRAIDRVNVFNCKAGNRPSWCIYLHISDVTSNS